MKGIQKYELTVMIEKNLSTNERKLKREIEKLLSQSSQLRDMIEKNLSTNERKLKREIEKLLSQSSQLREVKLVQVIKV